MLKRIFYSFFLVLFSLASIFLLAKGWQVVTGGFRLDKVEPIYSAQNMNSTPLPTSEVKEALSKKFRYLDRGCQTYVFLSEDGKYVLKLIRYSKYKLPFWMPYLSLFSQRGDAYINGRVHAKEKAYEYSMRSYRYAMKELPNVSSALFIHLEKTDLFGKHLTLIDRLGRSFLIDLDTAGYILQRKVVPFEKMLIERISRKDERGAEELVSSFFCMVEDLLDKGLINRDYNCVKNSGYLDGKVMGMDLGSFYPLRNLGEKGAMDKEVRHFAKHFRRWTVKNYPSLLGYFDERMEKTIDKYVEKYERVEKDEI